MRGKSAASFRFAWLWLRSGLVVVGFGESWIEDGCVGIMWFLDSSRRTVESWMFVKRGIVRLAASGGWNVIWKRLRRGCDWLAVAWRLKVGCGVREKISKIRFSKTPKLPAAKATIKVTLIYIPAQCAGGGLHNRFPTPHQPSGTSTHPRLF